MQYFGGHGNIKDHRPSHIGYKMIFQVLKEVTVTAWRESANLGAALPDQKKLRGEAAGIAFQGLENGPIHTSPYYS
jgi:hypothetical protein